MNNYKAIARAATVLLLVCAGTPAKAAALQFAGTFSGGASGFLPNPFEGSWSASFDDSQVTGFGVEIFTVNMDQFLATNPVGATTFNASNTNMELQWTDGSLTAVRIGDTTDVISVTYGTDDFVLDYDIAGGALIAMWLTNTGVPGWGDATLNSGSFTVGPTASTPEPGLILPSVVGGLALSVVYRRRRPRSGITAPSIHATT